MNPFKRGTTPNGQAYYVMAADDRVRAVKSFTLEECRAALQLDDLQKTVERAIAARIRKLEKEKKK